MANRADDPPAENERAAATAIANGSQEKPLAGLTVVTASKAARQAFRASVELGDALADLPLDIAREIVSAMLGAVDDVRHRLGRPTGMVDALCVAEPVNPDFLKSRDDWRSDLMRAWRALPQEDRAAFLARVGTGRAAA